MNPQRWQKIKDLFSRALEEEPRVRAEWLAAETVGEEELRREVEVLLANHEEADDFIESSPMGDLEAREANERLTGQYVGHYRLLDPIGRGGMGTVYLAERDDDEFRQRVAIKLIRLGMDSPGLLARFRQERQILADLEHPGIARLIDGGTVDGDRPFLVMEHVEGEPIDRYCARRGLSVRARLELFLKVCDAVQFAHRNLVIHRDLKPSNVLVTADGSPKLLDFGTAKLLDPASLEAAVTLTGLGMMTPHYASPEQLRGGAITTASDVYALGVVLYELLAGCRPYQLTGPLSPEVVRVICEDPPERPSAAVLSASDHDPRQPFGASAAAAQKWSKRLEGDLDTIVAMAMRKEPERRYASVERLAEDVRRYLDSLPVHARPDTLAYRSGKFLRRHRLAALASTAVVLALAGGLTATLSERRRATAADERAAEHSDEAEIITNFLLDLFGASEPAEAQGDEVSAREILERGVEAIQQEIDTKPEVRARLMSKMGVAFHGIGDDARAGELLEEALTLQREDGARPEDLSETISRLGLVLLATGELERAGELLEEALARNRAQFGESSFEVAQSLDLLGEYQFVRGRYAESRDLHRRSLATYRSLDEDHPEALAEALNDLGGALYELGSYTEAESYFEESLALRSEAGGEDHPSFARTLDNLAAALIPQGRNEEALARAEQALAAGRRIYAEPGHRQLATTLRNLGVILHGLGRDEEAESRLQEALAMRRRLLGEGHRDVASSLEGLGVFYQDLGDVEAAEEHYRDACRIWTESLGAEHPASRACERKRAWHLYWAGRGETAATLFRNQVSLERDHASEDALLLAQNLLGQGLALSQAGNHRAALPALEEAYRERKHHLGATELTRVAAARDALADCLIALGEYERARPLAEQTQAEQSRSGDPSAQQRAQERLDRIQQATSPG